MTKRQKLDKVKVAYLEGVTLSKETGTTHREFRWFGYYPEGGEQKRVYIGTELPPEMRRLAKPGRYITPEMFE